MDDGVVIEMYRRIVLKVRISRVFDKKNVAGLVLILVIVDITNNLFS